MPEVNPYNAGPPAVPAASSADGEFPLEVSFEQISETISLPKFKPAEGGVK